MSKAIVLLSGGMDSTTALSVAIKEGFECYVLTLDYGQRHQNEINSAKNIVKDFEIIEHKLLSIDLTFFGGSALTDGNLKVPEKESTGIPITYVPARNTIFFSLALAWAEVVQADPVIILYANSAPGIECYEDTEKRPAQQLVDEGKMTSFVGIEDASGDPTDNEAVVQRIMEAAASGSNPGVFFGLQASDCAELVAGMVAAGYDGVIVSSASCKDDSVLSQPFSHGMIISGEEEIYTPNEGIELSAYQTKYNPWRDANQDAYGPDAPKSQFMNVAHDVMVTAIITMMRFENSGGDVDDNAALIEYLAGQDNWNRAGRSKPMDCTTNSSEFVSVCKKDAGYYIWNGYDNGGWSYGPLGTEILDATDLLLRMAEGANARPAAG